MSLACYLVILASLSDVIFNNIMRQEKNFKYSAIFSPICLICFVIADRVLLHGCIDLFMLMHYCFIVSVLQLAGFVV